MAAIKALELWCKVQCDGYRDVSITNMTTSFRSGLAFCALIHKYRPDLIDYDSLRREDVFENNKLAFQVAEEKLGIPALLDAEDMVALRIPDRLSILTYVSQYYNYFNGRSPMGGVKRPAEGSKEEPSEKKNLPVVAKTFVSKSAIENRLPTTLLTQTATKPARAAVAQKAVLAENSRKNDNASKSGTLNSKCVACKSHVHLVQRHFVDGKLYHRSCFKCSECSSLLHAGAYKPGKEPDAFICKSCKPSSSEATIKNGPSSSAGRASGTSQTRPAPPPPSSVLSAPPHIVLKPVSPSPPSQAWTPAAQRTQAARQRFFQAPAPPLTEASTDARKPAEPSYISGWPKVPQSPEHNVSQAKATSGKRLAEENCNNNNRRPFIIRSAERRFGDEPKSADSPRLRTNRCSQGSAGNWATSRTDNKEPPRLQAVSSHSVKPTTVHTNAKDPVGQREQPTELKPAKTEPGSRDVETKRASTEQQKPASVSPSPVSVSAVTSLPGPTPAVSPVTLPLFDPAPFREASTHKPSPVSGNTRAKRGSRSSAAPPPRSPAVESISSSPTAPATAPAPANHVNPPSVRPSGAKKGKYLSPTNASRPEMRSPSSHQMAVEQIEKELDDIERNLACLEKEGVELEKKLRSCEEEGEGDILMDPLMVDWFNLIRKKQMYIRKESELVYTARTQELERQQPGVEWELRRLLEKPDHLKSTEEQQLEGKLMRRLVEIVDGRNAIVEGLDEDRLREVEEDQQLNEMMQNLGVKKAKNKRKSSISKLFRRRSKRRVE
ncbi:MICAL-like protein 2a [Genypterus blacodes]|uniref:MICAL-like protein 2a n=1 Tax=Genypterus blacodes TaxID=154954 RepID=UPI003F775751